MPGKRCLNRVADRNFEVPPESGLERKIVSRPKIIDSSGTNRAFVISIARIFDVDESKYYF